LNWIRLRAGIQSLSSIVEREIDFRFINSITPNETKWNQTQTISYIHVCETHTLIRKPSFDRDERERFGFFEKKHLRLWIEFS
jgi:hypothetical protein